MNTRILFQLKKSLNFTADDLGKKPGRIVSLVPSQTELLHYLGLEAEVVGITKFCVHPHNWFRHKTRVGGTKSLDLERIKELQPDLIIANKEENRKEDIETLAQHYHVYVSDIATLDDALQMITDIGALTATTEPAAELVTGIRNNFNLLKPIDPPVRAAYLIWQEPLMAAGNDTFINDMMQRCGLQNIFGGTERYPETSVEWLRENNCEVLLLSSEPFPFKDVHAEAFRAALPGTKVLLVDGEMFSWYGSRLLLTPGYLGQLSVRNYE